MGNALVIGITAACIKANSSEWDCLEDKAAWKKATKRKLVAVARSRLEALEAQERQRRGKERMASLAVAEAAVEAKIAETIANASFLKLDPSKSIRFSRERKAKLELRNCAAGKVAFRVKTSAANAVMVQPAVGILDRNEHISLQVVSTERLPDVKFVVQAALAPDDEAPSREKWSELESQKKTQEWQLDAYFG